MIIKHKIDAFLHAIFPQTKGMGETELEAYFSGYYSSGIYKPTIIIDGKEIVVEIDETTIIKHTKEYYRIVKLCENGKYSEAKVSLQKLIQENPKISEYYRIYGQNLSDEGDQKEAINYLIDTLRWDNTNGFTLMMIGNIYTKHFKDIANVVIMSMIAALTYLKKQSSEQLKKMAFEFASAGETGINMEMDDYSMPSLANKTFTGKQFSSWFYVSWAVAFQEHLEKMGLEFEVAKNIEKDK